jgi:hypothetical protein
MNLGMMLRANSAARNPQKPALICSGHIVSYEELDRSGAVALAGGLKSESLFASKPRLIAVPVNNRLKPRDLLEHSKVRSGAMPMLERNGRSVEWRRS